MSNLGDLDDVDLKTNLPMHNEVLTYDYAQSKWVPKSFNFPGVISTGSLYLVELDRWGINNNSTDAVNTSKGINNALIWAVQNGYAEVTLPKGTYLIDENNPIKPPSFLTLNLNGSTLRIRNNGLEDYVIVKFSNVVSSKIKNGIVKGDRYGHDYSSGGTHEGGYGIKIEYNSRFISIDNIEIQDCTGDGITTSVGYGGIPDNLPWYTLSGSMEAGGIDMITGALVDNNNRVRSIRRIDVTNKLIAAHKAFLLNGNGYSSLGSEITAKVFDVVFYKSDNTFLSSTTSEFFDEIEVPDNASYAMVALHQSNTPTTNGNTITIRYPEYPKFVYIENCNIHHNSRLGLSLGGQYQYIRNNDIHHNSGTSPASGIDIEDGGRVIQNIFIENNKFYQQGNAAIILVTGKSIRIINNTIENNALIIYYDATRVTVSHNHFIKANVQLDGEVLFSNNQLFNSSVSTTDEVSEPKPKIISNCWFKNSSISLNHKNSFVTQVVGCIFNNDSSFMYDGAVMFFGEPQILTDCTFRGNKPTAIYGATKEGWVLNNITFVNNGNDSKSIPRGAYKGCKFINSGILSIGGDSTTTYEFDDCYFKWDGYTLFNFDVNIALLRFNNSTFLGSNKGAFFVWNLGKKLEFINNRFEFPNATSIFTIIDLFQAKCESVLLEGNKFTSNKELKAISASGMFYPITFKNNSLNIVVMDDSPHYNPINNEVNGVIGLAVKPAFGHYELGQEIKNSNPLPGENFSWVCVIPGFSNKFSTWSADYMYWKASRIFVNGHVYEAQNDGRSAKTQPIFPTNSGGTIVDNDIIWKELGLIAVFKQFGSIQM
ncbi:right-handed parallel beta-helix repeat-containing protein [Priestia megaterium]|uniref:right-handed parallel beta-helix repeat-containing protein n=1 Tax=Priestia megaterium TaxID=1404 RepID=UPI0021ACAF76|nr:right-handed parallel beta-helix repeat-containing protein [Priestia megaterium]MCR8925002.1 right-handed parallel beta-helix repeat-containing protein [Priestia megaterium]